MSSMIESESESENENEKKIIGKEIPNSSESSYEDEEEDEQIPVKEGQDEKAETLVELQSSRDMAKVPKPMPQVAPGQPLPRRKRFIPKYEVEGTFKIALSEETQLAIEMAIGTHVNTQYPWKDVSKENIMHCIDTQGQNCEFYPLLDELNAYEGNQVLMGYVTDATKDVEEFYICLTKESREHCKQQSDRFIRRQERKLLKAVSRKPGPWTSLGSEKEIIELIPVYNRPLMEIEVKARFPTLYDPEKFSSREVTQSRDGYIELTPYRQKFNNVYRRRVHTATQVGLSKVNKAAQTVLRYPQNMWTQSIADALGKYDPNAEIDEFFKKEKGSDESSSSEDEEDARGHVDWVELAAYRNAFKRLRRPSYLKLFNDFVSASDIEMLNYIELNSVMDIYVNDYAKLITQKAVDTYSTMTFENYVCFTDVRAKDKYISSAAFHPMWTGIVALAYSDGSPNIMKYVSTRPDPIQRAVYGLNPVMIWSHIDSLRPKLYLECSREVKSLAFCPFNENVLAGGCINGQVVIWDLTNKLENVEKIEVLSETREKYKIAMNSHMGWFKNVHDNAFVPATVMSNLLTSHYGAITAICWLSPNFVVSNTGKQDLITEDDPPSMMIFTGSEDGTIQIWNLSTQNVSFTESKKVKKSRRVLRRPSGLLTDVSPYKILDRNLQPCFRIILGIPGRPQLLPIQTMEMTAPPVVYTHTPPSEAMRTGRKYFKCEVLKQTENDISNTIYCGSQHGEFRKITFEGHAFNTGELVNSEYGDINYKCCIHDGIVTCNQRNPFIKNIILTCGGKIFAIWSDRLKGRPLIWKKRPFRLTDAKWSMYKPSLMFITTSEGDIETWDLLLRSDQPIAVQTVSGSILTGISVHTLPCPKNIIGVSDSYGSFKMFIDPPIFLIKNHRYVARMEIQMERELKVMQSFLEWQDAWMRNNPEIKLEMQRKEGALLAEKEEEKRRKREEEERRLEEEEAARALAKNRVIGPAERWQMIIQKLIERTIAVKKRINREELIEHEKPLRELEIQRLEKERRMLEIMKNQKTIFNDTVAILFPEAIQKPPKVRRTFLDSNREKQKNMYLEDYETVKSHAAETVRNNPYRVSFMWETTLAEGKERRQALSAHETYIKMHKCRITESDKYIAPIEPIVVEEQITEEEEPIPA